ncbi:hypothetical protein CEQ90_19810 [Lewinellaceae bacterium SD302]|nr:hypothetical protein CEQ90_19810 [Lewinellaceae bacterium SD302]
MPLIVDSHNLLIINPNNSTENDKDGFSTWFFEVNEKKEVLRQIVKFDNLPYQSYSYAYYENDKGGLTLQKLCNDYIADLEIIDVDEFELFWIERPFITVDN